MQTFSTTPQSTNIKNVRIPGISLPKCIAYKFEISSFPKVEEYIWYTQPKRTYCVYCWMYLSMIKILCILIPGEIISPDSVSSYVILELLYSIFCLSWAHMCVSPPTGLLETNKVYFMSNKSILQKSFAQGSLIAWIRTAVSESRLQI